MKKLPDYFTSKSQDLCSVVASFGNGSFKISSYASLWIKTEYSCLGPENYLKISLFEVVDFESQDFTFTEMVVSFID